MNWKRFSAIGLSLLSFVVGGIFVYQSLPLKVYAENNGCYKICPKNRPLGVFVWSATCGNCVYNLPHISALKQKFEELGGEFILVLTEDKLVMRQMGRANFIRFNINHMESYFDKHQKLQKKYNIEVVPVLLLFDKKGKLLKKIEGYVPWMDGNNMSDALVAFDNQ